MKNIFIVARELNIPSTYRMSYYKNNASAFHHIEGLQCDINDYLAINDAIILPFDTPPSIQEIFLDKNLTGIFVLVVVDERITEFTQYKIIR